MKIEKKDIFLKLIFNILKYDMIFTMINHFFLKKMKIEKFEKLLANLYSKKEYILHIRILKNSSNYD